MWADDVTAALVEAFTAVADPAKAAPMQAYMKDVAPFLGIPAPQRRAAQKPVFVAMGPAPSPDALGDAARRLWALPEREYAYAASELIERHVKVLPASFLAARVEALITTRSWWDTVDSLVGDAVAPLVVRHNDLVGVMRRWIESDDQWLVRAAVLHQLGRGLATDRALLAELCARRAGDTRFFVAKAVGWALRDLSWRDPDFVEAFIAEHPELSTLARREGSKRIDEARSRIGSRRARPQR
jgi:3-methyladenine DNA glycosylase AlkD